MMSINVQKLRGKMAEKGYNITSLSEALGIDRNTLSAYFKAPEKVPYSVLANMAAILFDSTEEATSVLFAMGLRKT